MLRIVVLLFRKDHHSYWPNFKKIKCKDFICSKYGFKKGLDLNSQMKLQKLETILGYPAIIRNMGDEKASGPKSMIEARIRTIDAFSYLVDEVGVSKILDLLIRKNITTLRKTKKQRLNMGTLIH
ncbi:hypothetical protein IEQ34_018999 [Dendrobium chrysotoxum]|uniref:DNA-directed RNA polymerase n=1 Tax=Dendrobium chrysotoxum TaxID=161865 RepID=A0AAV7G7C9_DENCH|nr:hypothetical protein IEQ34_018999 [Dendrobium chrysotoxum]